MASSDRLENTSLSDYAMAQTSTMFQTRNLKSHSSVTTWVLLDVFVSILAGLIAIHIHGGGASVTLDRFVALQWRYADFWSVLGFLVLYPVFLSGSGKVFGLYHASESRSFINEQRLALQTVLTATLMLCGTLFISHTTIYASRTVVAVTTLQTIVLAMFARAFFRILRERRYKAGNETRNVFIVGQGKVAQALRNHIDALPRLGLCFRGFISYDPLPSSDPTDEGDLIGDLQNCISIARANFVERLYFATPPERSIITKIVEEARLFNIEVHLIPDLYEGLAWNARVDFVGQIPTILVHHGDLPSGAFVIKRVMDIFLSIAAIILLSPLLLFIAGVVRFDTPGPMLYRSERIGRKGRKFICYKFRTMVENADVLKKDLAHLNEREGLLFKISKDPRVTRSGAWLRKYSLDELPQLFNVLFGDMSLVGPRPPLGIEVARYDLEHLKRLDVLPGITGLWQVEARQDSSFDNYISLDTAYVDNWNLMMDLRILVRTLGVVFRGTGC